MRSRGHAGRAKLEWLGKRLLLSTESSCPADGGGGGGEGKYKLPPPRGGASRGKKPNELP